MQVHETQYINQSRSFQSGLVLADHKTSKSNPQENTGLSHCVISVCKTLVHIKMLNLASSLSEGIECTPINT